jgi:hypothetical protein
MHYTMVFNTPDIYVSAPLLTITCTQGPNAIAVQIRLRSQNVFHTSQAISKWLATPVMLNAVHVCLAKTCATVKINSNNTVAPRSMET